MWMEENGLTWVCGIELWIGEFIEWVCGIEFGTKALNKWALMLLGEWSFVESIRKRSNLEQCLQTNAMPMRSESVWTLLSNLQKRTEWENQANKDNGAFKLRPNMSFNRVSKRLKKACHFGLKWGIGWNCIIGLWLASLSDSVQLYLSLIEFTSKRNLEAC